MTKSLILAALAAVTMTGEVHADAANLLLSFSTPGPDLYADGSTVIDGEWYALVWSSDGVFEGLSVDGDPIDPNDSLVLAAPIAKDGRCPFSVFQLDSQSKNSHRDGIYAVWLLDTRTADKTTVAKRNGNGRPSSINAVRPVGSYSVSPLRAGVLEDSRSDRDTIWKESIVDSSAAEYRPPQIVSFSIKAGLAEIEVVGLHPAVKYNVQMGETPTKLTQYAFETPQSETQTAHFSINAGNAHFFRVIREPLVRK